MCFSTSFRQTETETVAHTLLNFLLHLEMRHTLQVDVHREATTEQMQGDTGFQLCKYTCTQLPPVLPCCHFIAYYSLPPEKKSIPELNDQFSYFTLYYKISKWSRSFTAQRIFQEGTIFLELWKWSIPVLLWISASVAWKYYESSSTGVSAFKMVTWIIKCQYHINSSLHVIGRRGGTIWNVRDDAVI
jgi:hypothetical protein